MPIARTDWTVEMLNALPDDGNRYEVIDGELFVTPAPTNVHQRAMFRLAYLLAPYVDALGLDILTAPTAVTFSARREVQPDVLVLPRNGDKFAVRFQDVGRLVLAVEVLSPHTARVDRHRKRLLYQDEQVPEYWIVDTTSRTIERWRPDSKDPEIVSDVLSWQPVPSRSALLLDLPAYFRMALGE